METARNCLTWWSLRPGVVAAERHVVRDRPFPVHNRHALTGFPSPGKRNLQPFASQRVVEVLFRAEVVKLLGRRQSRRLYFPNLMSVFFVSSQGVRPVDLAPLLDSLAGTFHHERPETVASPVNILKCIHRIPHVGDNLFIRHFSEVLDKVTERNLSPIWIRHVQKP